MKVPMYQIDRVESDPSSVYTGIVFITDTYPEDPHNSFLIHGDMIVKEILNDYPNHRIVYQGVLPTIKLEMLQTNGRFNGFRPYLS